MWTEIRPGSRLIYLSKCCARISAACSFVYIYQGEFIYKTFSNKDTVVLNRKDSLCYECLRLQFRWRKTKEKVEDDHKRIQSLLSAKSASVPRYVELIALCLLVHL